MNFPSDICGAAQVFQSQYGMILAVARRYAPTPDLVYDVVQQSFIDFAEKVQAGTYSLHQDCAPLLHTIVKNRALKAWRERREHLPEYQQKIFDRLLSASRQRSENNETLESELKSLHRCLEKLPDPGRNLIERHYFEGVSMEKIASEKSVNPGSLRQTFCRLRMKLKDCIEKSVQRDS